MDAAMEECRICLSLANTSGIYRCWLPGPHTGLNIIIMAFSGPWISSVDPQPPNGGGIVHFLVTPWVYDAAPQRTRGWCWLK